MDADGRNETDIFRYTDVEYTPDGHSEVYRWEDFLGIAGGHVYSAMDTIDMVSATDRNDIAKTSILSPAISSIRFPWTISQGLCAATC